MLKKSERLTKRQFDEYFKNGQRFSGRYLQILFSAKDTFHGAVVVGKKVYSKAHARNRLRRRLYGVLYQQRLAKNLKGVYIVLVKPNAAEVPYLEVRDDLVGLLDKIV